MCSLVGFACSAGVFCLLRWISPDYPPGSQMARQVSFQLPLLEIAKTLHILVGLPPGS